MFWFLSIIKHEGFKRKRLYHHSLCCGENTMKGNLQIYYDEEGDFLELNLGNYTEGYFRDIKDGIAERIDKKTGKVTGIAILGFKKRTEKLKDLRIELPLKIEITS